MSPVLAEGFFTTVPPRKSPGYILKVERKAFPEILNVRYDRRGVKDDSKIFGRNTEMMELSSTEMGKFVIKEVLKGCGKIKNSVVHISCLLDN